MATTSTLITVEATAVLKKLEITATKKTITFESFPLVSEQVQEVTELIENKSPILLTLKVTPADKNFPPIQSEAVITKCDVCETTQQPKFAGLQFSSDQVAQMNGYITGKDELTVVIQEQQVESNEPLLDGQE